MSLVSLPKTSKVFETLKELNNHKKQFQWYLTANELGDKSQEIKVAHLRCSLPEPLNDLVDKLTGTLTVDKIYDHIQAEVIPKDNKCFNQYCFFNHVQKEGQTFNEYYFELDQLGRKCELGEKYEEVLKARLVCGLWDQSLKERLMRSPEMTLKEMRNYCRVTEDAKLKVEQMVSIGNEQNHSTAEVHVLESNKRSRHTWQAKVNAHESNKRTRQTWQGAHGHAQTRTTKSSVQTVQPQKFNCSKCGTNHLPRQCPAFNKLCLNCSKPNHFAISCRYPRYTSNGQQQPQKRQQTRVHGLEQCELSSSRASAADEWTGDVNTLSVDSIRAWVQRFKIGGVDVEFKLDTGADINVIPESVAERIHPDWRSKASKEVNTVEAYGGHKIQILGNVQIKMRKSELSHTLTFSIVKDGKGIIPILGREACVDLGLIKKVENLDHVFNLDKFLNEYSEVFEGTGEFPQKYKIILDKTQTPTCQAPRRVAYTLMDKLKVKLDDLVKNKIIEPVTQPKNWCSNLVVRQKPNGDLRLCLDPIDLNKAIKREYYLIPTLEEIKTKLIGKTIFSVVDLKDGFNQISLHEESKDICTFNSPLGYFRYLRVPFGLVSSPEIFMKYNIECFSGIDDLVIYFDDILIASHDQKSHVETLSKVFKRAKELNIKFNKNKLQLMQSEIAYLGHIFNKDGCKIDKDRVKAIENLKEPKSVKELQSMLGMYNYLREFVPNMSEITAPLRVLLKKDVAWHWNADQQLAFDKLKEAIAGSTVLKNFDLNKDVVIQTDSSQNGLGCCLLQDGKPIAFASRSLTETEKKYAQIEKETLAIKFAVRKFHKYIWGRRITVQSDHLPLVSIFKKNICQIVSDRIVRMRLSLLKYDLDVKYLPGKDMLIADHLSRNFPEESYDNEIEITDFVHNIYKVDNLLNYELIKKETEDNLSLAKVMKYLVEGWPQSKCYLEDNELIRHFFKLREELICNDGIIYYQDRIVIPSKLKQLALFMLHSGHLGISKTILRAQQTYYWVNMNNDIEAYIKNCLTCQENRPSKIKEPLLPYEIPDRPFQRICLDIMNYKNIDYLVIVDSFSKWIECLKLKSKSCHEVIIKLKTLFATFGIPDIIVSDNSPFNSYEIKCFATSFNIQWRTSSPHYPTSNGQSERAVGICKDLLRKADSFKLDFQDLLMEYRATPIASIGVSPSELLMGRLIKTKVLINPKKLSPVENFKQLTEQAKKKIKVKQNKVKEHYDKSSRIESEFTPNENILLHDKKKWVRGKIVSKTQYPRSYNVQTENGQILRRNTSVLKHTSIEFKTGKQGHCMIPGAVGVSSGDNFDDLWESRLVNKNNPQFAQPLKMQSELNNFPEREESELASTSIVDKTIVQNPTHRVGISSEEEEEFATPLKGSQVEDHTYCKTPSAKKENRPKREVKKPAKFKEFELD